jgi:glycosyltransferase involved in cell wall biosynthesis
MEDKKIKLLFYGDSPTCSTGFGHVSKEILNGLHKTGKYDISVVAINYYGDPHDLPYKLYPASINQQNDVYGRQRLLDLLRNKDDKFDVLFTLQDTFVMATIGEHIKKLRDGLIIEKDGKKILQKGQRFKWIYYYPIDAKPKKDWIEKSVKFADIACPYTNYAMEKSKEILDREYHVMYHGVDTKTYYQLTEEEKEEFRNKFFKENNLKNNFLMVNVNRNQERKNLFHTLLAFKIFRSIVPNSVLYTHCDVIGDRGGNLIEVAEQLGILDNWLYPNPKTFNQGKGFNDSFINSLYNIADINISTTLGEGWGLSCSESMAAKTLNVFPNNTSLKEILADDRGILYESGDKPNHLTMNGPMDNSLIRPTANIDDMVEKMLWAYSHYDTRKEMEEKAYQWVIDNITWEKIVKDWDKLITDSLK